MRAMADRAPLIIIASYALGFLIFWPVAPVIADEAFYVRAAESFAHGRATLEVIDPLTEKVERVRPSYFAPGTSLLEAPFVRLSGFGGAPFVSLLCFAATGFVLLRWLVRQGHPAAFSLPFLGFLPALVLARTAMSELPSALVVCATHSLIFAGPGEGSVRPRVRDGGAGFLAGLSLLFRETNAILVVPFIVGAMVRREGRTRGLLLGFAIGCGLTLLVLAGTYGTPLYLRPHLGWSLGSLVARLPINALILVTMAPFGLLAALTYRGQRRPEVLVTTVLTVIFFSAYAYTGAASGGLKQIVLTARFFIPLIPLLSICLADAWPRWMAARRHPAGSQWLHAGLVLAVSIAAFGVHPVLGRMGHQERTISDALWTNTSARGALVMSRVELDKYVVGWSADRRIISFRELSPAQLPFLVARDRIAFLALLDRDESTFHRSVSTDEETWRRLAAARCRLDITYDQFHAGKRLRIFRVIACRDS